jgi:hypothetical protein
MDETDEPGRTTSGESVSSITKSSRRRRGDVPGPRVEVAPSTASLPSIIHHDGGLVYTPLFGIGGEISPVRVPTHGIPFVQPSNDFSLREPPIGKSIFADNPLHDAHDGTSDPVKLEPSEKPVDFTALQLEHMRKHHDRQFSKEEVTEQIEGRVRVHERIESTASVMSQGKSHAAELMLHLAGSRMNITNEVTANNLEPSSTEPPATDATHSQAYWPYSAFPPAAPNYYGYRPPPPDQSPWAYPSSPFAGPTNYWSLSPNNWAADIPSSNAGSYPFPQANQPLAISPVVPSPLVNAEPIKSEGKRKKAPIQRQAPPSEASSISDEDYERPPKSTSGRRNARQRMSTPLIPGGDPKSLACHMCGKTFTRRFNLRAHERSHLDIKPFKCGTCSQSFCRRHDLKRHERLHTGAVPYSCDVCGKGFNRVESHARHKASCGVNGNGISNISDSDK